MQDAVLDAVPGADALIMAAAVADFSPQNVAADKIKKGDGVPEIVLTPTPDILANLASVKSQTGWPRVSVGFAAETRDLLDNARAKLEAKSLDLVVANDISATDAGFGVDTNRVALLYPDGRTESTTLMGKDEIARLILDRVVELVLGG
jgi:phosphopantothenoylcysteine decarboxylase/phosphopantothenate--cysteine ligase